jgi:hypothetical protein
VKKRIALIAIAALLLVAGGGEKTFKPPFKLGSSGGDRYNYVEASRDGAVTVARMYPLPPGGVECTGLAGWATLRAVHRTANPPSSVRVSYTDAVVDPYTFITVTAKAGPRYIGARKIRGPVTGDGTVKVPLRWPGGDRKRTVRVEFGLELTSGCPAVDGGHAQFTKVTLSPKRLKR